MSHRSSDVALIDTRAVRRVAILTHPRIRETVGLAEDLASRLAGLGVVAEVGTTSAPGEMLARPEGLDCLITLGGDGSIVRAARAAAGTGVPVLGINLGQLGFLAELQPGELAGRLEALARGEFRIEERVLLSATLTSASGDEGTYDAMNDAVVARGEKVRAIAVAVAVDGQPFVTYRADGVIVATPTGSTAYSLAVGGPILAPTLECLLIIPVAPHLMPTRALVVPSSSTIRLQLCGGYQGVLSVDGQVDRRLVGGDAVRISVSPRRVGFVRFGPPSDFYGTLFRRLRWTMHRS